MMCAVFSYEYMDPVSYAYYAPGTRYHIQISLVQSEWPSCPITPNAQLQQQSSIAILAGSREGTSTCTTHTYLWPYECYSMYKAWFVQSYSSYYSITWLLCDV